MGNVEKIPQLGFGCRGDGREKQGVVLSFVFRRLVQIQPELSCVKTLIWIVPLKGQVRILAKGPAIRDIVIDIDLPSAGPHP